MYETIELKTFKALYPTYADFEKNVIDKVITIAQSGKNKTPYYVDETKLPYSFESLWVLLSNKYEAYAAINPDERQHKLMVNALLQTLPALYMKCQILDESILELVNDPFKLLTDLDQHRNIDPDTQYASTESAYSSTPDDDQTSGSWKLSNVREKNITLRKDATVRLNEVTNYLNKLDKLTKIDFSGYINEFINSIEISSLWEFLIDEHVMRVIQGANAKDVAIEQLMTNEEFIDDLIKEIAKFLSTNNDFLSSVESYLVKNQDFLDSISTRLETDTGFITTLVDILEKNADFLSNMEGYLVVNTDFLDSISTRLETDTGFITTLVDILEKNADFLSNVEGYLVVNTDFLDSISTRLETDTGFITTLVDILEKNADFLSNVEGYLVVNTDFLDSISTRLETDTGFITTLVDILEKNADFLSNVEGYLVVNTDFLDSISTRLETDTGFITTLVDILEKNADFLSNVESYLVKNQDFLTSIASKLELDSGFITNLAEALEKNADFLSNVEGYLVVNTDFLNSIAGRLEVDNDFVQKLATLMETNQTFIDNVASIVGVNQSFIDAISVDLEQNLSFISTLADDMDEFVAEFLARDEDFAKLVQTALQKVDITGDPWYEREWSDADLLKKVEVHFSDGNIYEGTIEYINGFYQISWTGDFTKDIVFNYYKALPFSVVVEGNIDQTSVRTAVKATDGYATLTKTYKATADAALAGDFTYDPDTRTATFIFGNIELQFVITQEPLTIEKVILWEPTVNILDVDLSNYYDKYTFDKQIIIAEVKSITNDGKLDDYNKYLWEVSLKQNESELFVIKSGLETYGQNLLQLVDDKQSQKFEDLIKTFDLSSSTIDGEKTIVLEFTNPYTGAKTSDSISEIAKYSWVVNELEKFYTKDEVDVFLQGVSAVDLSNYYDKDEVDLLTYKNLLYSTHKQTLDGGVEVKTFDFILSTKKLDGNLHSDNVGYYFMDYDEINDNFYDKNEIDKLIGQGVDLSNYFTKDEVTNLTYKDFQFTQSSQTLSGGEQLFAYDPTLVYKDVLGNKFYNETGKSFLAWQDIDTNFYDKKEMDKLLVEYTKSSDYYTKTEVDNLTYKNLHYDLYTTTNVTNLIAIHLTTKDKDGNVKEDPLGKSLYDNRTTITKENDKLTLEEWVNKFYDDFENLYGLVESEQKQLDYLENILVIETIDVDYDKEEVTFLEGYLLKEYAQGNLTSPILLKSELAERPALFSKGSFEEFLEETKKYVDEKEYIPYLRSFEFNTNQQWDIQNEVSSVTSIAETTPLLWSVDSIEKITKGIGTALNDLDNKFIPKNELNELVKVYYSGSRSASLSFNTIVSYAYNTGINFYCYCIIDGRSYKFSGTPMYGNGIYVVQSPIYNANIFSIETNKSGDFYYVMIDQDFVRLIESENGNIKHELSHANSQLTMEALQWLTSSGIY